MLANFDAAFRAELQEFLEAARAIDARKRQRPAHFGTPRDPLVQCLAARMLNFYRHDDVFARLFDLRVDGPVSYKAIADDLGGDWSDQRITQLYDKLDPDRYLAQARTHRK